jgi:Flp pilus assembly protein CpaB
MRASVLLVLGLALIVGLGVAVAVKSLGLLTPPVTVATQPPPPPAPQPVVAQPPRPQLLVATKNLFVGDTIRPGDVRLRTIRAEELEEYEKTKGADFVPPILDSVYYRFMAIDISADTPLRKKSLKELSKPEPLHARLVPGMRAINVSIPKIGSAGGLIQVGDWVDLYITTEIGRTDLTGRLTQTGVLVHHALVIAKRDTLFTGFASIAPETSIQYTLAVNSYRAALVEFGRSVGVLTMSPISEQEKKQLDELKQTITKEPSKIALLSYSDANSTDYKLEDQRIKDSQEGKLSVGSEDLIRVLNLKPIPVPTPPLLPPAPRVKATPPPPITVEILSGTRQAAKAEFPVPAPAPEPEPLPPAPPTPPQGRYFFVLPKPTVTTPEPTLGTATPVPVATPN